MSVKTEKQHTGAFLLTEANGTLSRDKATLKSGESVLDGRLLAYESGLLVAYEDDNSDAEIAGLVLGDWDASGGAIDDVPFIARLAEVRGSAIGYPDEESDGTVPEATVTRINAELLTYGIKVYEPFPTFTAEESEEPSSEESSS